MTTPTPDLPNLSTCAPWATTDDLAQYIKGDENADIITSVLQASSDLLFLLSGRQYSGGCTDTVRPLVRALARDHGRAIRGGMPGAYGSWWASGFWGSGYSGSDFMGGGTTNQEEDPDGFTVPMVGLGVYPLTAINEVLIDGAVVDPSTYTIRDRRWLLRLADNAGTDNPGWPFSQRTDLTPDQPGTWQVTMQYGTPPPPIGRIAAAEMAWQLYLAITPNQAGCKLPGRAQSVTRAGVSAIMLDPLAFLDKGRTGLTVCDYFLEGVNPGGLRRRGTVHSPDIGRRVARFG